MRSEAPFRTKWEAHTFIYTPSIVVLLCLEGWTYKKCNPRNHHNENIASTSHFVFLAIYVASIFNILLFLNRFSVRISYKDAEYFVAGMTHVADCIIPKQKYVCYFSPSRSDLSYDIETYFSCLFLRSN